LETEERLREMEGYAETMRGEVERLSGALIQKENMEVYLQEVINRLKAQVSEMEDESKSLADELEQEKERRIRADQQAKIFEAAQQLRGDSGRIQSEAFEKISKLQDEKGQMLAQIEQAKKEKIDLED
jgi:uncharacterized protein (UPF0218 family)